MKWTRKRVGLLTAAIFLVWLAVSLAISPRWYGETLWPVSISAIGQHYTLKIGDQPPVSYYANITLSTVQTFSVDNEIHVQATIFDVNLTDFASDFGALGFLNAGYGGAASAPILPVLVPAGNGVWKAEGDFTFLSIPIFTGPMLLPINDSTGKQTTTFIPALYTNALGDQIEAYNFPLCGSIAAPVCYYTIQPQSANTSTLSDETNVKNDVTFASLSALLFQPIFESILIPKSKKGKPTVEIEPDRDSDKLGFKFTARLKGLHNPYVTLDGNEYELLKKDSDLNTPISYMYVDRPYVFHPFTVKVFEMKDGWVRAEVKGPRGDYYTEEAHITNGVIEKRAIVGSVMKLTFNSEEATEEKQYEGGFLARIPAEGRVADLTFGFTEVEKAPKSFGERTRERLGL